MPGAGSSDCDLKLWAEDGLLEVEVELKLEPKLVWLLVRFESALSESLLSCSPACSARLRILLLLGGGVTAGSTCHPSAVLGSIGIP